MQIGTVQFSRGTPDLLFWAATGLHQGAKLLTESDMKLFNDAFTFATQAQVSGLPDAQHMKKLYKSEALILDELQLDAELCDTNKLCLIAPEQVRLPCCRRLAISSL